jgi:hypothetical protein
LGRPQYFICENIKIVFVECGFFLFYQIDGGEDEVEKVEAK